MRRHFHVVTHVMNSRMEFDETVVINIRATLACHKPQKSTATSKYDAATPCADLLLALATPKRPPSLELRRAQPHSHDVVHVQREQALFD